MGQFSMGPSRPDPTIIYKVSPGTTKDVNSPEGNLKVGLPGNFLASWPPTQKCT
jgi:hypothetical protein